MKQNGRTQYTYNGNNVFSCYSRMHLNLTVQERYISVQERYSRDLERAKYQKEINMSERRYRLIE